MSQQTRPKAPDHLSIEAALEWHRICDELEAAGRLDAADRAMLTLYCETWSIYQDVMAHVREHRAVVKLSNGVVCGSPFYKTSRECVAQMRGLLNDMGLTAMARAKVKEPTKAPAEEPSY